MCGVALPPDVRRRSAARCAARLCRPMCGAALPPDVRRGFAARCAARLCRSMCGAALPPDVRRGFAARCAARLCRPICGVALPLDVRRGFAARCAAWLCRAAVLTEIEGLGPWFGLCPNTFKGQGRTRGGARCCFPIDGKAEPCRTSGGRAVTTYVQAKVHWA